MEMERSALTALVRDSLPRVDETGFEAYPTKSLMVMLRRSLYRSELFLLIKEIDFRIIEIIQGCPTRSGHPDCPRGAL